MTIRIRGTLPNRSHWIFQRRLKLWLPIDEGRGTTAYDVSGSGNDMVTGGNPVWRAGKFGWSLFLDGTNDHLDANKSVKPNGDFSYSIWCFSTSIAEGDTLMDERRGTFRGAGIGHTASAQPRGIVRGSNDNEIVVAATTATDDGLWHHVVITWDESATELKIYIDGFLENSGTDATVTNDVNDHFGIGIRSGGVGDGLTSAGEFNGRVANAMVFGSALSHADVQSLYTMPWEAFQRNRTTLYIPGSVNSASGIHTAAGPEQIAAATMSLDATAVHQSAGPAQSSAATMSLSANGIHTAAGTEQTSAATASLSATAVHQSSGPAQTSAAALSLDATAVHAAAGPAQTATATTEAGINLPVLRQAQSLLHEPRRRRRRQPEVQTSSILTESSLVQASAVHTGAGPAQQAAATMALSAAGTQNAAGPAQLAAAALALTATAVQTASGPAQAAAASSGTLTPSEDRRNTIQPLSRVSTTQPLLSPSQIQKLRRTASTAAMQRVVYIQAI